MRTQIFCAEVSTFCGQVQEQPLPGFIRAPPGFSARATMAALGDLSVLGGAAALATDLDVTHELLAVGAAPLCMHSSPTSPSAR